VALPLAGAVAVVTGASSGIGEAIALRLAAEGAVVGLLARRGELLEALAAGIVERGGRAVPLVADVTDAGRTEAALDRIGRSEGRLDILVNAAGTARPGDFATSAAGSWQSMIDINLGGLLNSTHAALPHLAKAVGGPRGIGDVVNISSIAGRRVGPGNPIYSATKYAVGTFSEYLRKELLERSIRVSAVEPGWVDTPLTTDVPRDRHYRWLQPDEVADAAHYILTRPAHIAVNELLLRPVGQLD
jgi:NADP-dependent 3-hydroxy acid dehydrogenase YdfG